MGAEQIAALKPTSLNIVLLGTVSGPQRIAFAVMEEKGKKKQGLYQTGDMVQGALIKKVLRGKVIIEVKGKDEILEMEQAKTGKRGPGGPAPEAKMMDTPLRWVTMIFKNPLAISIRC